MEEVRDSALQLRMVKIGATFNRFQRVVHDVSLDPPSTVVEAGHMDTGQVHVPGGYSVLHEGRCVGEHHVALERVQHRSAQDRMPLGRVEREP